MNYEELNNAVIAGDTAKVVELITTCCQNTHKTGVRRTAEYSILEYLVKFIKYKLILQFITQPQLDALSAAVRELLRFGACPKKKDNIGFCREPWIELLLHGGRTHPCIFEQLVEAASSQYDMSVAEYIQLDGTKNLPSLLAYAINDDNTALIDLLLNKYGVNPWTSTDSLIRMTSTSVAVTRLLVDAAKCHPAPEERKSGSTWSEERRIREYVNLPDLYGRTMLHVCSDVELAEFLIANGSDVNATDVTKDAYYKMEGGRMAHDIEEDGTADAIALLERNTQIWDMDVRRKLIKWSTNFMELCMGRPGRPGKRTSLHYALASCLERKINIGKVKVLLDNGASLSAVDEEGLTPIQFGTKYGINLRWKYYDLMSYTGHPSAKYSSQYMCNCEEHAKALQLAKDKESATTA